MSGQSLGSPPRRRDAARFIAALHALLAAGIRLADALAIIGRGDSSRSIRALSAMAEAGLRDGLPLAASLARITVRGGRSAFDQRDLAFLAASERSGALVSALARMVERDEAARETRSRLCAVLAYPVFVVVLSAAGTAFVFFAGIPALSRGGFPDSTTREAMATGALSALTLLAILSASLGYALFRLAGAESPETRAFTLIADCAGAGMPVSESVSAGARDAAGGGAQTRKLAESLAEARDSLSSGCPLAEAFAGTARFPPLVTDLMGVEAASGNAAGAFRRAAGHFAARDRRRREAAARAVEPAAIIVTGIYLAFLLESVVVPLLAGIGGIH